MVTSCSSTAVSLQLAGAVSESPGVPVAVVVGVRMGVRVAGSVAVTNTGVAPGGVGADTVTSQALKTIARHAAARTLVRMPRF